MKRIAPEQVDKAYATTGLKPGRFKFYEGDTHQACGLGVIAIAESGGVPGVGEFTSTLKDLGYDYDYIRGFAVGFDNKAFKDHNVAFAGIRLTGWRDGVAAAARVFA